ncbi:hypothetical protein CL632_01820 [bacterium]|jgi:D-alanyl-D-alanine carboxypeptidase|nr:hypothetical protein [bacterium]MDP6571443.1 serine hydrolase [Patescibacteria group bacterium]MDP6756098.1 serine hydrolase [Patescibacteria group bacterium]|tara:strand:- start:2303 stop:3217 length:915 start_codon:yes stop_codon:yes gene_type:complete
MHLFSILLSIISLAVPTLPIIEHEPYISNSKIRADRVFSITEDVNVPEKIDSASLGPRLSAGSALVVDAESGAVLFEKDGNISWPMASIVKLMTALVFLEADIVLEERVEMTEEDEREGGEDFIRPGESSSLRDYLTASLLGSANNATIVLSRSIGISTQEFVNRMNQRAKELGMRDTKFVEPSGLDPENTSTSYDMVRLLNAIRDNEIIADITGTHQSFIRIYPSGFSRRVLTTNHLLGSIVFVEYGKTGYLDESLHNLATLVSTNNGNELYIVTLGSETNEDRVQDAKNLAVWAERVYRWNL